MIKLALKGIAVVLMVAVGTVLFLYLSRTDPWGRVPGKKLLGEEVTGIEDWSFTEPARIVTLEVRPSAPYSINASCLFHEGAFYTLATSIENRWVQLLLEDPNVRFRVGREDDKLYQGRATVVEDAGLINDLFDTLSQKYRGGVDRTPEQRASYRFIRLGSR